MTIESFMYIFFIYSSILTYTKSRHIITENVIDPMALWIENESGFQLQKGFILYFELKIPGKIAKRDHIVAKSKGGNEDKELRSDDSKKKEECNQVILVNTL